MDEVTLSSLLLRAAAVLFLVAANAFFVAAEFGLVASRRTRIEGMARDGDARAKLAYRAIQSLDRYISGTQLGITAASLSLGWIGEPAVAGAIESAFRGLPSPLDVIATHAVAGTVAFLFITFLHIVLGELAPKAVALLYPEATSRYVAGPLILFTVATNPFIWLLNGSANAMLRLFGIRRPVQSEQVHQPDEIVMLVRQSEQAGSLEHEDARMIEGVLELGKKKVRDVMVPRTGVIGLQADLTIAEAVERVSKARWSRYPVFGESPDDIVGIVHIRDILRTLSERAAEPVRSVAREAFFVPSTREVEDVLADMKRLKTHIAVVLDEYGGTAGIVTLEDLLEEIVGEIYDEYDTFEPQPIADGDGAVLPGEMEIGDVNEQYGLHIEEQDYQTIGGYVFGALGHLPRTGDSVTVNDVRFEVLAMDGRRVERVKMVKPQRTSPG